MIIRMLWRAMTVANKEVQIHTLKERAFQATYWVLQLETKGKDSANIMQWLKHWDGSSSFKFLFNYSAH